MSNTYKISKVTVRKANGNAINVDADGNWDEHQHTDTQPEQPETNEEEGEEGGEAG